MKFWNSFKEWLLEADFPTSTPPSPETPAELKVARDPKVPRPPEEDTRHMVNRLNEQLHALQIWADDFAGMFSSLEREVRGDGEAKGEGRNPWFDEDLRLCEWSVHELGEAVEKLRADVNALMPEAVKRRGRGASRAEGARRPVAKAKKPARH